EVGLVAVVEHHHAAVDLPGDGELHLVAAVVDRGAALGRRRLVLHLLHLLLRLDQRVDLDLQVLDLLLHLLDGLGVVAARPPSRARLPRRPPPPTAKPSRPPRRRSPGAPLCSLTCPRPRTHYCRLAKAAFPGFDTVMINSGQDRTWVIFNNS